MSPTRIRLVSWNVHGVPSAPRIAERLGAIARAIAARKPDLVLLQEVWRHRDAAALEKRLRRGGYTAVGVPTGGLVTRKSGLLAFVSSAAGWRVEAEHFHEFETEASDWKLWEGDGFGDKGIQGFTLARDGFTLDVLNTHLQADYAPGSYAEVRRSQIAELRELAETRLTRPLLLAGDLNTTPDEPGFEPLHVFLDLGARLRESCACGTSVDPDAAPRWIDHLLARVPDGWRIEAELSLLRSQRKDVPYSDHQGIDAALRLTPPADRSGLALLATAKLAGPTTRREFLASAALLALGG